MTVCFLGSFTTQDRLLHHDAGGWQDVTTSWTPTQICGSVSSLSPFAIGRLVNRAPSLALPADIVSEAASAAGALVSFAASASDPEDGVLSAVCSPASGTTFSLGVTTVNCSATDSAGATANGSFTVTVRDSTPNVVTVPAAITVPATEAGGVRAASWPALATFLTGGSAADLVDASPAKLAPQAAGVDVNNNTRFPVGTTAVTFRFRDVILLTATKGGGIPKLVSPQLPFLKC